MASPSSRGEVALIEAVGPAAARVPAASAAALQCATHVLAQEAAHPNLLSHAPTQAQLGVWDPEFAIAQANAGAHVVGLMASIDDEQTRLRASGVSVQELRAPPALAGPLAGRRILTTRPRSAAHVQRDRFVDLGADAVALPSLELQGPEDPAAFDRLVASVAEYDGVILSSRAGVDAWVGARSRLGADRLAPRLVVAVGGATAQACVTAGIVPDIVPEQARSEGIARALAARSLLGGRWIHVRARDGRDTLDEAISSAGGVYQLAVGYRSERPSPPAGVIGWLGGGIEAICLHSGRTGQHLREMLEVALPKTWRDLVAGAAVVSAGPVTTKALQEQGFEVAATAESPGDDGMLQAVVELLGSTTGGES